MLIHASGASGGSMKSRVAAEAALTSPLPRAGHASFSKKEDVRTAARPSQVENVSS